ncbi:MAG: hypothetical protein ACLFV7_04220 [Phycisphaerae bacterium]
MNALLASRDMLPETLHFLNLGWWIIHVVAIVVVGAVGYALGRKNAAKKGSGASQGEA